MFINKFSNISKYLVLVSVCFLVCFLFPANSEAKTQEKTKISFPTANNAFALSLFPLLAPEHSNFVFSPLGINAALFPAVLGAPSGTATRSQMLKALFIDGSISLDDYTKLFGGYSKFVSFKTALVFNEVDVLPTYKGFLEESLPVAAQLLGGGVDSINSWARRESNGQVDGLIDFLTPKSQFVLLNLSKMSPNLDVEVGVKNTEMRPFLLNNSDNLDKQNSIPVTNMSGTTFLPIFNGDGYRATMLPLRSDFVDSPPKARALGGNNGLRLGLIIPKDAAGLPTLVKRFNLKFFNALVEDILLTNPQQVVFNIPSFKINSSIDLDSYLKALGVTHAFDYASADFSTISSSTLFINRITHGAYLDFGGGIVDGQVDGQSTTTTSASSISGNYFSKLVDKIKDVGQVPVFPISEFSVDRPFIFFVYHQPTKTILFLGKVDNPSI